MHGVVADTHSLVWYLVDPARLSAAAGAALDGAVNAGETIYVSSISLVELVYLVEKGRLPQTVVDRLQAALNAPDAEISVVSFGPGTGLVCWPGFPGVGPGLARPCDRGDCPPLQPASGNQRCKDPQFGDRHGLVGADNRDADNRGYTGFEDREWPTPPTGCGSYAAVYQCGAGAGTENAERHWSSDHPLMPRRAKTVKDGKIGELRHPD